MNRTFSIAKEHRPKPGLTISTPLIAGKEASATVFTLGGGTDISPETYDNPILYIGLSGGGDFLVGSGHEEKRISGGELLAIDSGTLCGVKTSGGFVYTEIISKGNLSMNSALKTGEAVNLADFISYEAGSVANMDIASNDAMKFVLMAFDDGTRLSSHRAPGDALIFALEGKAVISCGGEEHEIRSGENFRFAKNEMHSVTADGKFKMALLLILE